MAQYLHVRDSEGGTSMVLVETDVPKIEAPAQPEVESAKLTSVYRCQICSTPQLSLDFAIAALGAKHFHREHMDLDHDKTSWQTHIEKVLI